MGKAAIVSPTLSTLQAAFRDPDDHHRPRLRYACRLEYRAWVHVITLGVRMVDPSPLRDARNVYCRALMDMGVDVYDAESESKDAVRKSRVSMIVNGVKYMGTGADGRRFRAVAVDIGETRVVAVVPAKQREISVEITDV